MDPVQPSNMAVPRRYSGIYKELSFGVITRGWPGNLGTHLQFIAWTIIEQTLVDFPTTAMITGGQVIPSPIFSNTTIWNPE